MPLLVVDRRRREMEKKARAEGRLSPGQSLTIKWPVLHAVPRFDAARGDFGIHGPVETPLRFTWQEFPALPETEESGRIRMRHNQPQRSAMLGTQRLPRPVQMQIARPAVANPSTGCSSVPTSATTSTCCAVGLAFARSSTSVNSTPFHKLFKRLQRVNWKRVKWVRGLTLLDHDQLGFWERNGITRMAIPGKSSGLVLEFTGRSD